MTGTPSQNPVFLALFAARLRGAENRVEPLRFHRPPNATWNQVGGPPAIYMNS